MIGRQGLAHVWLTADWTRLSAEQAESLRADLHHRSELLTGHFQKMSDFHIAPRFSVQVDGHDGDSGGLHLVCMTASSCNLHNASKVGMQKLDICSTML